MWTRAELKDRAKACMKKYYWMAFLACLIVGILGGSAAGGGAGVRRTFSSGSTAGQGVSQGQNAVSGLFDHMDARMVVAVVMIVGIIILIGWIVGMCWGIFLGNMMQVGKCRFFMESRARQESAGLGKLFYCFNRSWYLNTVKVMFLKNLFVTLWTLLLVVPGVIKSYEYRMVPYILSENPQMYYKDALALSKQMMDGHKWAAFVLDWSFIGWELLGFLLCGVGSLFVAPYVETTMAELYAVLRQNSGAVGSALPGFGEQPQELYVDYTVAE